MLVLERSSAAGLRATPVFSTMLLATTFLDRAQAMGHVVPLDYVFPVAGDRFSEDFPEYVPMLDISPEGFFQA